MGRLNGLLVRTRSQLPVALGWVPRNCGIRSGSSRISRSHLSFVSSTQISRRRSTFATGRTRCSCTRMCRSVRTASWSTQTLRVHHLTLWPRLSKWRSSRVRHRLGNRTPRPRPEPAGGRCAGSPMRPIRRVLDFAGCLRALQLDRLPRHSSRQANVLLIFRSGSTRKMFRNNFRRARQDWEACRPRHRLRSSTTAVHLFRGRPSTPFLSHLPPSRMRGRKRLVTLRPRLAKTWARLQSRRCRSAKTRSSENYTRTQI